MKLHWSPRSPFVRKVMVCAHELGVADRIQTVRTTVSMEAPNAALLPDNPLGKIPTMVLDDGGTIYDSLTICEYLDAMAGPLLFPAAGPARWTALTWHALGTGMLDMFILWRNERDKAVPHRAWLEAFALKSAAGFDAMERLVPALEAAPFGIGHVTLGIVPSYVDFRFPDLGWRTGRPALTAWHAAFAARPSMRATEAVDA